MGCEQDGLRSWQRTRRQSRPGQVSGRRAEEVKHSASKMGQYLGSKPQSPVSNVAERLRKKRTVMFGHRESMADFGKSCVDLQFDHIHFPGFSVHRAA